MRYRILLTRSDAGAAFPFALGLQRNKQELERGARAVSRKITSRILPPTKVPRPVENIQLKLYTFSNPK